MIPQVDAWPQGVLDEWHICTNAFFPQPHVMPTIGELGTEVKEVFHSNGIHRTMTLTWFQEAFALRMLVQGSHPRLFDLSEKEKASMHPSIHTQRSKHRMCQASRICPFLHSRNQWHSTIVAYGRFAHEGSFEEG
jgi:hypothetical protein